MYEMYLVPAVAYQVFFFTFCFFMFTSHKCMHIYIHTCIHIYFTVAVRMTKLVMRHSWVGDLLHVEYSQIAFSRWLILYAFRLHLMWTYIIVMFFPPKIAGFFICKTLLIEITLLITVAAFFTVLMLMRERDKPTTDNRQPPPPQYGQAYIFFCSCLKGWLQALGVGSRSLMVFQWVFVRSDCAPPGGLRSSPRVIYYLSPPPAALWLRGRCQQRRGGGDDCKGVLHIRQDRGQRPTLREYGKVIDMYYIEEVV